MSFNVKDYGAVGNGSTDDTTSFNNAISALNSAGAGMLIIPSTTNFYKIAGTLISITAKAWVQEIPLPLVNFNFMAGSGSFLIERQPTRDYVE